MPLPHTEHGQLADPAQAGVVDLDALHDQFVGGGEEGGDLMPVVRDVLRLGREEANNGSHARITPRCGQD